MERLGRYGHPPLSLIPRKDVEGIKMHLEEHEGHFHLRADLPGIPKEGIQVSLAEGRRVIIEGHNLQDEERKAGDYLHRERRGQRFLRSIELPMVVEEEMEATYEGGTLFITLKKALRDKSKIIEIK